jgi:Flp pilus assembly pilin Flp
MRTLKSRIFRRVRGLFRDEAGQGMTEYVMLVLLVALVCLPIAKALPAAVRGYIRPFYFCVSRPVP